MNKKGISAVIATILLLVITIALGGVAYYFIIGYFSSAPCPCEAFCVMNDMEYDYQYGGCWCYCEVCEEVEIMNENHRVCEKREFLIVD